MNDTLITIEETSTELVIEEPEVIEITVVESLGGALDPSDDAQTIMDAHIANLDPHTQYLLLTALEQVLLGYETAIGTKGSAFNKNFGTGAEDVLRGNTAIPSISGLVPETRTINGLPLSADIVIETAGGFASHYHFCEDSTGLGTPVWHELEVNTDGGAVGSHTATTNAYTEFDRYLTHALNTTIIPAGDWNFTLYCSISSASAQGQVKAVIYRVDASGTIIGTALGTAESAIFNNTNVVGIRLSVFTTAQSNWNATDRIGIIVYGKRGNTPATVTFQHNQAAGYGSNVSTPLTLLHNQMNGLNHGDYQHLTIDQKTNALAYEINWNYSGSLKLGSSGLLRYINRGGLIASSIIRVGTPGVGGDTRIKLNVCSVDGDVVYNMLIAHIAAGGTIPYHLEFDEIWWPQGLLSGEYIAVTIEADNGVTLPKDATMNLVVWAN